MTFYNDIDEKLYEYGKQLIEELRNAYVDLRDEGCDRDLVYAAFDYVFGPGTMPEVARLAIIRTVGNELEKAAYDAVYEDVEYLIFEDLYEE